MIYEVFVSRCFSAEVSRVSLTWASFFLGLFVVPNGPVGYFLGFEVAASCCVMENTRYCVLVLKRLIIDGRVAKSLGERQCQFMEICWVAWALTFAQQHRECFR